MCWSWPGNALLAGFLDCLYSRSLTRCYVVIDALSAINSHADGSSAATAAAILCGCLCRGLFALIRDIGKMKGSIYSEGSGRGGGKRRPRRTCDDRSYLLSKTVRKIAQRYVTRGAATCMNDCHEMQRRGMCRVRVGSQGVYYIQQESPADAGIPARRKNDEKNSSISKL